MTLGQSSPQTKDIIWSCQVFRAQAFDHAAWTFRNEQVWVTAFVCGWLNPVSFMKSFFNYLTVDTIFIKL